MTETNLPHSPKAEDALLSCLARHGIVAMSAAAILVEPEEFHDPVKGFIYGAMRTRWESGQPFDGIIVRDDLKQAGIDYSEEKLAETLASEAQLANVSEYATIVYRDSVRRKLIEASSQSASAAQESADHAGVLDYTYGLLSQIEEREARTLSGEVEDIALRVEAQWAERAGHVGFIGHQTGIDRLDRWTDGIRPGHMHVITGFTNVGKSMVMVSQVNGLLDHSAKVDVFSMEMSADQLFTRLVANRANVDSRIVEHGIWTEDQAWLIRDASTKLRRYPLRIFDKIRSAEGVKRRIRFDSPDVGFIDYFQRISGVSGDYSASARNASLVYDIPKASNCGLVVYSQISAAAEEEKGGGEIKTKGGNELAENADVAMLLYRDKIGNPNVLEVMCKKNRHGPAGVSAQFRVELATGRLEEIRMGY